MKRFIYAAVGTRKQDGIVAAGVPGFGMFPLCFMEEEMLPILQKFARQLAEETHQNIAIQKFELQETICFFEGAPSTSVKTEGKP